MLRILLTGGGTGGHVNPAIAIADTIRRNQPDAQITFVGVEGGKECDLVPHAGYPLEFVDSKGFTRSLSPANIKAAALAVLSPYLPKTRRLLQKYQPDCVIGTGGYVSWPLLRAASLAGIPTVVHESNCLPGLAVKMISRHCDRILLNFPESADLLPKKAKEKCLSVGNPIRGSFDDRSYDSARQELGIRADEKLVLAYAGSLGSATVNAAMITALRTLAPLYPQTRFLLATGIKNFEAAQNSAKEAGLDAYSNVELKAYVYDMPLQMAAADVVISRAGAMSLSELARMGKATVVVPSPYVTGNHQYINAKALADRGAAVLVEEKDFPQGNLTNAICTLLDDPAYCKTLAANIRGFDKPDANRQIYEEVCRLAKEYRQKQDERVSKKKK